MREIYFKNSEDVTLLVITEFIHVLCATFIFQAFLRTSKEAYNVAFCWDSFFLREQVALVVGCRLWNYQ